MLWLLFGHFIGDIALQSAWQADNKGRYWYVMLSHVMIWCGVICFILQWLGLFAFWKFVFLFVGHFLADEIKARQPKTVENWWMIYPDQTWHIIQLMVVYFA